MIESRGLYGLGEPKRLYLDKLYFRNLRVFNEEHLHFKVSLEMKDILLECFSECGLKNN